MALLKALCSEIVKSRLDSRPLVSIMIPTYDRFDTLAQSIHSALSQKTDIPYEVVVVDNNIENKQLCAQIDNLILRFSDSRLSLIRNRYNLGMFGNWNQCISLASSANMTILNDDDILLPCWMQTISQFIGSSLFVTVLDSVLLPECRPYAGVSNHMDIIPKPVRSENISFASLLAGNPVKGCLGALFHRELALEMEGYDPVFYPTSDYAFTARYILAHGGVSIKYIASLYGIGLNESMKEATVRGFIVNDYVLRTSLINQFASPSLISNSVGRTLSLLAAIDSIWNYKLVFNPGMSVVSVASELFLLVNPVERGLILTLCRLLRFRVNRVLSVFWSIYAMLFIPTSTQQFNRALSLPRPFVRR